MLETILQKRVNNHPKKTAIIYDDLRISYQELYGKVKGFSQGLSSLGIGRGDCVALILPNCPEFAIAFFAVAQLNAIILPLNHLFKGEEISYYIHDSHPQAIITDRKRAEICKTIISELDKKIDLIVVDGIEPLTTYFYDLILPEGTDNPAPISSFAGDVLYQYSSGSTGRPKKVCRTQHNLYHEVKNFTETVNITSADTILCLVPLYHAHGLGNCLLAAICNGATLVILEQVVQKGITVEVPFVFRRERVLEMIEKERVTILPIVPYIVDTLAETPSATQVDLSGLRLCFSAGNFLGKDTFDKFLTRFGVPVRQLYGCTEAGSIAINLDADFAHTYDSVGIPIKNVEIEIIDDGGNQVDLGNIGEVAVNAQSLTGGYFNMSDLNREVFKDGWYLTGDLGKLDSENRLYITGRKKLLIDTGGYKVDPIEIEDILLTHPHVKEAVVVGVKGDGLGEIIKAVIVLKSRDNCDKNEMTLFCRERLAEFKIPKLIEFREEIPKSPLGKILRKELI